MSKPYFEESGISIYHGDSLELLLDLNYQGLVTDPPYGISLSSNGRHFSQRTVRGDRDQEIGSAVIDLVRSKAIPSIVFADPMKPWPGEWRQHLVWDKGEAVGSGGDPKKCWRFDWEMIQCADTPNLQGGRDSSVLRFPVRPFAPEYDFQWHPCQKPVSLLTYLLKRLGDIGTVVDPFMGSGSTLIAAKNMGRKAIGIELEEKYCEIAAMRLSQQILEFA